jgi:hypothetical protein
LGNNEYFFDEFEENSNAIYTIIMNPDKYEFNLTEKELEIIKNGLQKGIILKKIPVIVHMTITIINIYCGMNSNIFYFYLLKFSQNQLFCENLENNLEYLSDDIKSNNLNSQNNLIVDIASHTDSQNNLVENVFNDIKFKDLNLENDKDYLYYLLDNLIFELNYNLQQNLKQNSIDYYNWLASDNY